VVSNRNGKRHPTSNSRNEISLRSHLPVFSISAITLLAKCSLKCAGHKVSGFPSCASFSHAPQHPSHWQLVLCPLTKGRSGGNFAILEIKDFFLCRVLRFFVIGLSPSPYFITPLLTASCDSTRQHFEQLRLYGSTVTDVPAGSQRSAERDSLCSLE
jgi:hypothetical protein